MNEPTIAFRQRVTTVLARFFRQNAELPPADAVLVAVADRLHAVIVERGLPPPLPEGEFGQPGGLADGECTRLVGQVLGEQASPLLADVVKQLVKACFYPEFAVCRDSYREATSDGTCKRQQLKRARGRASGAHCVDCPHWVRLEPASHAALLERAWHGDPTEFRAHRDVFLPEDFRALRQWLHAAARRS